MVTRHYLRILGHELGVEVVEVGDGVTGLRAGDRCAVEPYLHCGHCISSRNALGKDLSRIIRLMEHGEIDTRPWITHRAGVDDVVDRFPSWLDPHQGVVKAMLAF